MILELKAIFISSFLLSKRDLRHLMERKLAEKLLQILIRVVVSGPKERDLGLLRIHNTDVRKHKNSYHEF